MTLNSHGFDVNIDRVDEPLDQLPIIRARGRARGRGRDRSRDRSRGAEG